MSTADYTRPEPRISRATGELLQTLITDTVVAYWSEKDSAVRYWNDTTDKLVATNVARAGIAKGVIRHERPKMTRSQRTPLVVTDVGRTVQQRRWPRAAG